MNSKYSLEKFNLKLVFHGDRTLTISMEGQFAVTKPILAVCDHLFSGQRTLSYSKVTVRISEAAMSTVLGNYNKQWAIVEQDCLI